MSAAAILKGGTGNGGMGNDERGTRKEEQGTGNLYNGEVNL